MNKITIIQESIQDTKINSLIGNIFELRLHNGIYMLCSLVGEEYFLINLYDGTAYNHPTTEDEMKTIIAESFDQILDAVIQIDTKGEANNG